MSRDTSACIQAIRDASGGKLSHDEADDKVSGVLKQAAMDMRNNPNLSEPQAIAAAAKKQYAQEAVATARKREETLVNLQKRVNNTNVSTQTAEALAGDKGLSGKNIADSIQLHLSGIQPHTEGGRLGVFQMQQSMHANLVNGFGNELTKTGFAKAVRDEKYNYALVQELHALSSGGEKAGVSGDEVAIKTAPVMAKYLKLGVKSLNDQGANIKDLMGYVVHQTHDWLKIKNAGDGWAGDVRNWIDPERTTNRAGLQFGQMDSVEQDEFLRHVQTSLVSGKHLSQSRVGFEAPEFTGPGNAAKRVSQSRLLHFKDADSTYQYMTKYGNENTVLEGVLNSLKGSSNTAGLMKVFGTNPEASFTGLMDRVSQHLQDKSLDNAAAVRDFQENYRPKVQKLFDELAGKNREPANDVVSNIGQAVRLFENVTKLGRVLPAHFSLLATRASADNHWGVSTLSSFYNTLSAIKYNRFSTSEETKILLDRIGAHNDAQIGAVTNSYNNDLSGHMSAINNSLMKLNGFPQFMSWQKMSAKVSTAQIIGEGLDKSFDKLHPEMQANLKDYGINEKKWDMLRSTDNVAELNGRKYFTADMADRIDNNVIKQELLDQKLIKETSPQHRVDKAIADYKNDLGLNITAMQEEEARRALNIPGVNTRLLLNGSTKAGSVGGELRRLLTQFKQWPTELILNSYARNAYASQTTGQAAFNNIKLAALLTFAGYMRVAVNNAASGKDIPDPRDPKTMGEAFLQGGAGTVMLDSLAAMGRQNDFKGVVESVLGPALGEATELGVKTARAAKGGNFNNKSDAERWNNLKSGNLEGKMPRWLPGQNLIWMNAIQNYMHAHMVQTMNSPGWDSRYAQALKASKPVVQSH